MSEQNKIDEQPLIDPSTYIQKYITDIDGKIVRCGPISTPQIPPDTGMTLCWKIRRLIRGIFVDSHRLEIRKYVTIYEIGKTGETVDAGKKWKDMPPPQCKCFQHSDYCCYCNWGDFCCFDRRLCCCNTCCRPCRILTNP